jgi:hypothetical protein
MGQKKKVEYKNIRVKPETHEQLKFVSKITNVPMAKIIEQIAEAICSLSINYESATFQCYNDVTSDTVFITIHGYGKKLQSGTLQMPENATDREIDAKIKEEFDKGEIRHG